MADCFCDAKLPQISPTITSIDWPQGTIMWLERIPLTLLTEPERANGIRLEQFDPTTNFDDWARGRIFSAHGELRWEQQDGMFWTVYCGENLDLPGFTQETLTELESENLRLDERSYFLWGKRVEAQDLPTLGLPVQTIAFVELQIPRILRYPISNAAKRVKIKVKEYFAADGSLAYARFIGLEEIYESL